MHFMSKMTLWLILFVTLLHVSSYAQTHSPWEKAAWVTGSAVALGVFDYIGYNLSYTSPTALTIYRISFVLAQAGVTYMLYEKLGLPSAIAVNLIWWTFGIDMVYYGACELSPLGGHWNGPGSWEADSRYGIQHAGWTPVGLLRGEERIPRNTIIAQAIAGAMIGIGISISF